ncbi:MAG: hypothetical protein SGILL_009152, partial [Bacillariaceae sp.]
MSKRRSILIEDLPKPGQSWDDFDSDDNDGADEEESNEDEVNPMEALLKAEQRSFQRSSISKQGELMSSYNVLPETGSMDEEDAAVEEKKDEPSHISSSFTTTTEPLASAPSRMPSFRRQESNIMKPHREFELARSNSGLDIAKVSRVERSWLAITENNRIGEVGEKIFFRMFADYPDLIQLFPFGQDDIDTTTGKLKINKRTR